jgi:pyruvate dehydrogenase E1 component
MKGASVDQDGKKSGNVSRNDDSEIQDWLESLDDVVRHDGVDRAADLLDRLREHTITRGIRWPYSAGTPYINTIPADKQPPYPGNRVLERRIKSIIRWNAMAMVVRANREEEGIGGHISTYASAATLYEVAFNHFLHAPTEDCGGDQVYFQGHAAPGIYARAFLEGRLTVEQLKCFRHEHHPGGGLSSYPHPWLMPDFWQFPTVSMGLGPIMAIYQARFNRYLEDRGLKETSHEKVWCFMGDGETDEPESLGAITLPAREKLDNLIFVINCNLQRLDGPVRGNGRIIQELETVFRGAGWNVIKVVWGNDWDDLLARDKERLLVKRMGEVVDGEYQNYIVKGGAYIREHFFGTDPRLLGLVEHLSDEQLEKLRLGGHDPEKIYAAYKAAVEHKGSPTVILARTIKGYGLGEAGEGKNITHQQKKLNEEELREFKARFDIPVSDEEIASVPFYRPDEDGEVLTYLRERREQLYGYLPQRAVRSEPLATPPQALFEEFNQGSGKLAVATTMAFVRLLSKLLQDGDVGKLIVPIVPDEARTFGMESLFRQVGIYSHAGQLYEPVDRDNLLYYKEATDGQILEEGITEAGAMSSFIAAGTAYSTHGVNTIPFFVYYSMFGFQRIGDLIWAAADMRARGFIVGGTSGRTTLAGEGLQHQDGHSHLLVYPYPTIKAYDPAFAYEMAVIVRDGLRRMYQEQESVLYYLTVMNEPYVQPAMRTGIEEGIVKGIYKFKGSDNATSGARINLLGSGAILNKIIEAGRILEENYGVAADVWSVTSYKELHRDGLFTERWNMLHPQEEARIPYLSKVLAGSSQVCVAASDYSKALPESVSKWIPGRLISLGTDGFGRSDGRSHLRDFFEVDERYIALAAMYGLALDGQIDKKVVADAIEQFKIDPEKINPMTG